MKEIKYKILVKILRFFIRILPNWITSTNKKQIITCYYRLNQEDIWLQLRKPFSKIHNYESILKKIHFGKFKAIQYTGKETISEIIEQHPQEVIRYFLKRN